MATNIDPTPIPTQRVRRTLSVLVSYDPAGALSSVAATRYTTVQQNGVDITERVFKTFTVLAADLPPPIAAQLTALYTRIDNIDNTP